MLQGKKIILGVCGGIAAYKAAFLVRLLVKAGADVRVIMTHGAHQFITPLTLSVLSGNPVMTEFSEGNEGVWNNHVDLGLWADLIVIAPATANTLAKMAEGRSDNLLTTVYLSARNKTVVAPAMDLDMYKHPTTKENLDKLRTHGVLIIPPGTGELASGLSGEGRLAEPGDILKFIEATFYKQHRLSGKHFLITAGPTYEAIDPVRFIGNHSTGKMGVALANELAENGARVTLIAGPIARFALHMNVNRIDVVSAQEMYDQCMQVFQECDGAILAAAVADYRPKNVSETKIKKEQGGLQTIELTENPDILASLGAIKGKRLLGGFALETNNEEAHAISKLERKHLNFIVMNSLRESGAGFAGDTNRITIFTDKGERKEYSLKSKKEVAADIAEHIVSYYS
ncbi:MAG: bifunctional phosphopantothenoylcysteine decarboxylase/phosphopantothenate--cysteine ligase CoaBC [Bacteroidia bacterium]